jgi:hypothetical protein
MAAAGFPLDLDRLARETASQNAKRGPLPPVENWHPAFCGDSEMRIARDGTWFHQGAPIGRRELVRLFSTLLRKDEDGFMLVTPAERLSIAVEDAPFVAVLMNVTGTGRDQRLGFTTNVGDETVAGPYHPLRFARGEAPVPYVHVRGGLEAKLSRAVYYPLIELAAMEDGVSGIWSDGVFFSLEGA